MLDIYMVIIIAIAIFLLSIIALSIVFIAFTNSYRKRIEKLTLYQINTSSTIDESIPQILEVIIQESFTDYQLQNFISNEGYINNERESEIRKDLVLLVSSRISPAAIDKLSLFYNVLNISDVIADKIYIIVTNFVANHNSQFVE